MSKQAKQTYRITDKRGTRVVHLTERQALLRNLAGADVTVTTPSHVKRSIRRMHAQGIGTN